MIFVYQTLMASQMAVGANTVRPFRLQSHLRYSHNVRRNNSQHCLLLFIREKSKLSRFDIGLSRAPSLHQSSTAAKSLRSLRILRYTGG